MPLFADPNNRIYVTNCVDTIPLILPYPEWWFPTHKTTMKLFPCLPTISQNSFHPWTAPKANLSPANYSVSIFTHVTSLVWLTKKWTHFSKALTVYLILILLVWLLHKATTQAPRSMLISEFSVIGAHRVIPFLAWCAWWEGTSVSMEDIHFRDLQMVIFAPEEMPPFSTLKT